MPGMADGNTALTHTPNGRPWDQDAFFSVLHAPQRRRLLMALGRGGPQTAAQLNPGATRVKLDLTLKHLGAMRDAGIVVVLPNPVDGRKQLYGLEPSIQAKKTETGCEIEVGFCLLRS